MSTGSNSPKRQDKRSRRRLTILALLLTCGLLGYVMLGTSQPAVATVTAPVDLLPEQTEGEKDYSRFTHSNAYHSRLPCLLCHRRDDNSARIGFPGKSGHLPCAGCHTAQFADNTSPICTICHTNAETGAMKRFPSLKTFSAKFNHSRHSRVNCAVCHTSSRRGIAFSIPSDADAHSTCFKCHTSSAPATMSSCNVCHQQGRPNWTSESAKAYSLNFSHSRHVRVAGLSCSNCHTVRAGAARGRQVSSPAAAMHFAPAGVKSCAACHNGQRTFGANDFANCKRCHIDNRFRF